MYSLNIIANGPPVVTSLDLQGPRFQILFLGYSKAFDVVNHERLMNKQRQIILLVRWQQASWIVGRRMGIVGDVNRVTFGSASFGLSQDTTSRGLLINKNEYDKRCMSWKYDE